jgi:hypothetical protein
MKHNSFPRNIFLLFIIWILLFVLSACGGMPATQPSDVATYPPATEEPVGVPTQISPTQQISTDAAQPALLETRRLTLEFPPKIKADSASDIVRLTLEVDDLGNITPTAYYEENVITGEVIQIPNLYETHHVGVEASFDIAGFEVKPAGSIYQPMQSGKPVTFTWSIRSPQVGEFRGTIWVHLIFVDKITNEETRLPVSAQIVDIEAVDLFGFSTNFVKTSGVVGSVLGIIVGFPFFDDIVKYVWGKRKKKKSKKSNQ